MSNHTKGPWSAFPYFKPHAKTGAWFLYDGDGGRFILIDGDGNRDGVKDSDAFLISFAPQMFETLSHIASNGEGKSAALALDVINKMKRALAKRREDLEE